MILTSIVEIIRLTLEIALVMAKDMTPEQRAAFWERHEQRMAFWQRLAERFQGE